LVLVDALFADRLLIGEHHTPLAQERVLGWRWWPDGEHAGATLAVRREVASPGGTT
jgi:hypothetical protein